MPVLPVPNPRAWFIARFIPRLEFFGVFSYTMGREGQ